MSLTFFLQCIIYRVSLEPILQHQNSCSKWYKYSKDAVPLCLPCNLPKMRVCDFFEDGFQNVCKISNNGISSHNRFFYSVLLQFIACLLAVLYISFNANYRSDDPTERVWGVAYEVSQVYEK
jgi:hypothetical protein